jgi:NOL1/NOP2/sun family putative RNA methylase
MRALLGDEADAFFASYARGEQKGLRVNLLKLGVAEFRALAPWPMEPVPWHTSGFYLPDDVRPGKHPYHAAGLYYLQEPSAMAVVEALDVRPGQRVLDLAAAPGGKATQIAALLDNQGVLVANEVEGSRIKALGENLERWGARNVVLLNETPGRLADTFGATFDRVLLDAPCSGEGMFRRGATARLEWSVEHVAGCAVRQAGILKEAARLVRSGGLLVYSTCTFAPEENEQRIAEFLSEHDGWELVDIPKRHGIAPGKPEWGGSPEPVETLYITSLLQRAARLWPHRVAGEGHFIACLRKVSAGVEIEAPSLLAAGSQQGRRGKRPNRREPGTTGEAVSQAALEAWTSFESRSLTVALPHGQITSRNDQLFLTPRELPEMEGLRVVRPGLWLGTSKPGRFEPSHALALALRAGDAQMTIPLDSDAAERYLRGETWPMAGPDGWALVTVDGWPLGWGRRVGGIVKNFYPKGLRLVG